MATARDRQRIAYCWQSLVMNVHTRRPMGGGGGDSPARRPGPMVVVLPRSRSPVPPRPMPRCDQEQRPRPYHALVPQQPFLGTALLSLLSGRSATDYGRCTGSAVCCAVVFSSLLYSYESLCLHRRQLHKLEQFRTRCNKCIAVRKVATPLYGNTVNSHAIWDHTQCYLPPDRGDIPALTPAEAGTRLSDPGGMQG